MSDSESEVGISNGENYRSSIDRHWSRNSFDRSIRTWIVNCGRWHKERKLFLCLDRSPIAILDNRIWKTEDSNSKVIYSIVILLNESNHERCLTSKPTNKTVERQVPIHLLKTWIELNKGENAWWMKDVGVNWIGASERLPVFSRVSTISNNVAGFLA